MTGRQEGCGRGQLRKEDTRSLLGYTKHQMGPIHPSGGQPLPHAHAHTHPLFWSVVLGGFCLRIFLEDLSMSIHKHLTFCSCIVFQRVDGPFVYPELSMFSNDQLNKTTYSNTYSQGRYLLLFMAVIFILIFKKYFIYSWESEREKECMSERGRGRERILSRLHTECRAQLRAWSRTLRLWPELKLTVRHPSDWATQAAPDPGILKSF